ncbi:MAG TPA: serine/threonine-protein kinase, partial [Gaiellaceae bacterium]|nr:serine/threonine-protein kinase [Gaiellaceae bacterium]
MSAKLVAGRYEIERPLGHGAFATVDLARDVELDRPVALKRLADNLSRDEDLRARFLREARLAARLSHPNVVRVYDVGEDDDRPFIAMEYVDGQTLGDLVARRGPLPPEEVVEIGVQACRALAAAHDAGLVHRDVKSHNLFLEGDRTLKLGDFGIAVGLEGTRMTVAGTVLGTAAYLAPEQARGEEVTAAADIYALGVVLVELLTGTPDRDARLYGPLGDVVARCLAEDPRARPASAAELAAELAAASPSARTMPLPERPTRIATQIKATPRRRPRHRGTFVLV